MEGAFWKGKRVFLTGHTGFKGGWLAMCLSRLGAQVTGYALAPPTQPSLFEAARLHEVVDSLLGDVRDLDALRRAMGRAQPQVVFHLAAQSLVRASYADPVETYATNVMGTVNVLEAARGVQSLRVLVNVTSDKCYENREWLWGYREDEPMGGNDPYSSSKGCAELVTAAYRRSFHSSANPVAIASARAGNVIGGGDWAADRLIPDVVRAVESGSPIALRNPEAIRPWQHVLEPLSGYLALAQAAWSQPLEFAGGWNFGPNDADARSVRWVVERLAHHWGNPVPWKADPGEHPHEARSLKLDSSKARSLLGWRPRWPLDRALALTADWYRACKGGEDARELMARQIRAHAEEAVPA